MMLLAFHIMAVSLIIMVVGNIAYNMGLREGDKRTRRKLGGAPAEEDEDLDE